MSAKMNQSGHLWLKKKIVSGSDSFVAHMIKLQFVL